MPRFRTVGFRFVVMLGIAVFSAACEDRPSSEQPLRPSGQETSGKVIAAIGWLEANRPTPPEQWLASREAGADASLTAQEVETFRKLLARADRRYSETPRMIANRAVQLEEMLASHGFEENTRQIIEGLVDIGADDQGHGFGETAQHYFNARVNGATREEALHLLQRSEGRLLRESRD